MIGTHHLLPGLVVIFTYLRTGVTNLWPNTKRGPYHHLSHPYTSKQTVEPNLHRHPYAPTSNVTPT